LVIAGGEIYEVDPRRREPVDPTNCCVTDILTVSELNCLIFVRNHTSLMRWDATGMRWDTGRISGDGFSNLRVEGGRVLGEAWTAPSDEWLPFAVDLDTGDASGGAEQLSDYKSGRRLTRGCSGPRPRMA
jgi:hypothetical protein